MHVVLACPGLEHAHRGFESFARDCFGALHGEEGLHIELVKGSGPRRPGERSIPTLARDTRSARLLGRAANSEPFVAEHLAFSLSIAPLLARRRPDVVYFSEWHVGRALARLRTVTRGRHRLVLCNGTSVPGPYGHLDLVQHLTPGALGFVLDRGADPARNLALPLGMDMPARLDPLGPADREALRRRLELPLDRPVLISVAALNRQKRLEHLIDAVAAMPEPSPFLLMAGQVEQETAALRELAQARLGPDGYSMRTVPAGEVPALLDASDAFALCSLWESLPRALIEAAARGLPCVAHAYPPMEYVLGEHGFTGDLEQPGVLRGLIEAALGSELSEDRHRAAYERFSWDVLRPRYLDMFRRAVEAPPAGGLH